MSKGEMAVRRHVRRTFLHDSRRLLRIVEPSEELRLPLYLIAATAVFLVLLVGNGAAAFQRIAEFALADTSNIFRSELSNQARAFMIASGVIVTGYVMAVVVICVAFTHHIIGPRTALRRQVEALKNGDYGARTKLRETDKVFRELGEDLNELAQILARAEKGWD